MRLKNKRGDSEKWDQRTASPEIPDITIVGLPTAVPVEMKHCMMPNAFNIITSMGTT